jgi:nicotinate phosphoribosyltransferase
VAKTSKDKINMGGRKFAVRRLDDRGTATHEVLGVDHPPADGRNGRPLLQQFMKDGEILPGWTGPDAVGRARDRHTASMAELPRVVDRLQPGEPAIPTIYE